MRRAALLLALVLAAAGAAGCDDGTDPAGAGGGDNGTDAADAAGSGSADCEPSYPDDCLDADAVDYDCEGGEGDGPRYVAGPITVKGSDPFDLDRDGDGTGCDASY